MSVILSLCKFVLYINEYILWVPAHIQNVNKHGYLCTVSSQDHTRLALPVPLCFSCCSLLKCIVWSSVPLGWPQQDECLLALWIVVEFWVISHPEWETYSWGASRMLFPSCIHLCHLGSFPWGFVKVWYQLCGIHSHLNGAADGL